MHGGDKKIHTRLQLEILKRRDNLEEQCINGMTKKRDVKRQGIS
jgi:hypothetical protein